MEYPLPAVGALAVPWLLAALTGIGFAHLLAATAVLTDLGFLVLLRTCSGRRWGLPCLAWVLGVPLLGATAYARFDLLPGVLAGVALLLLARWPGPALAAAAVATAVKLWPVLLLPALLAGVRRPRDGFVLLAGLGAGLAALVVLLAGWGRLLSPLTYQSDRGLQIESVAATPAIAGVVAGRAALADRLRAVEVLRGDRSRRRRPADDEQRRLAAARGRACSSAGGRPGAGCGPAGRCRPTRWSGCRWPR